MAPCLQRSLYVHLDRVLAIIGPIPFMVLYNVYSRHFVKLLISCFRVQLPLLKFVCLMSWQQPASKKKGPKKNDFGKPCPFKCLRVRICLARIERENVHVLCTAISSQRGE